MLLTEIQEIEAALRAVLFGHDTKGGQSKPAGVKWAPDAKKEGDGEDEWVVIDETEEEKEGADWVEV